MNVLAHLMLELVADSGPLLGLECVELNPILDHCNRTAELAVALVAFLLFQYVGDPVSQMLGQDATPEDRARLRTELGLDEPFYVQFSTFVGNAVQGDFGISLRQGRAVSTLIKERLPATLELAFTAAILAIVLGIPAGVYTALFLLTRASSNSWESRASKVWRSLDRT